MAVTPDPSPSPAVTPTISARLDVPVVHPNGERRHLLVEVTTPQIPHKAQRTPLDVAFVVDVSGSMTGEKLDAVIRALALLSERMASTDRVTLVSFASDVQVHAQGLTMDAAGRRQLWHEVTRLSPRGSTNLSEGWQTGTSALVARADAPAPPGSPRRLLTVLLSDGHANAGVVEPAHLNAMAAQSLEQGVTTTCIGIGDGYSTTQLAVIADGAGGRFHHANTPDEIMAVLLGELGEVDSVAAEQVMLSLGLPAGITPVAYGAPLRHDPAGVACTVGSLYGGTSRTLVFALDFPAALAGTAGEVTLRLQGRDTTSGVPWTVAASVAYRHDSIGSEMAAPADVVTITRRWLQWLMAEGARLNDLGDRRRVKVLLEEQLALVEAYARSVPEAKYLVWEQRERLWSATEWMDARTRKELYISSHKPMRGERDLR